MTKYIAAIDQGTTSTRCMLFNHSGESVGAYQLEHEQIYPQPGWVEHDPLEIWARTQEVIKGALQEAKAEDIAAVGITPDRIELELVDKLEVVVENSGVEDSGSGIDPAQIIFG